MMNITTVDRGILRVHVIPDDQRMGRHNMTSPSFTPIRGIGSAPSFRDRRETRRTANIAGLPNVERPDQSGRTDAPLRQKKQAAIYIPIPPPPTGKQPRPHAPPAIRPSLPSSNCASSPRARSSARTAPADRRYIFSALYPHPSQSPPPDAIARRHLPRTQSFRNRVRNVKVEERTRRGFREGPGGCPSIPPRMKAAAQVSFVRGRRRRWHDQRRRLGRRRIVVDVAEVAAAVAAADDDDDDDDDAVRRRGIELLVVVVVPVVVDDVRDAPPRLVADGSAHVHYVW